MDLRESTEALPELCKERLGLCSLHPGFISPKDARCSSAQAKQRIQHKQARLSITAAYHSPGSAFVQKCRIEEIQLLPTSGSSPSSGSPKPQ